jgi:hypothetical protein
MSIWKRARKFGGGPTGITQNISDLLKCQAAETIFANSSLIVMLNQAPGDRAALARLLNISESQQQYINNARKGSGLIWTGQAIIPFYDDFPQNTRLYQMMSTSAVENQTKSNAIMEDVAHERLSRARQEETQQEKEDAEYLEEQKRQGLYDEINNHEFDKQPTFSSGFDSGASSFGAGSASMEDDDDFDAFSADPFGSSSSKDDDLLDDIIDDDDDDDAFPDEFNTAFGGGMNSMFNVPSQPTPAPKAPAAPEKPAQKPTDSKNSDALNSFFNI